MFNSPYWNRKPFDATLKHLLHNFGKLDAVLSNFVLSCSIDVLLDRLLLRCAILHHTILSYFTQRMSFDATVNHSKLLR